MESSKIKAVLIVVVAIFAALYLGISAATAQMETVLWVLGGVGFAVCLLLGRKIWLLLPFLGALGLTLRLPGLPSSLLLAQVLVIAFSILLLLTRKLPFQLKWTELEFWCAGLAALVAQAYLRNPVGVNIFGGATVGGKAYFIFALTFVAAALLAGLKVSPSELRTALRLSILGGILNFFVAALGRFVPSVAYWTGAQYASAEVDYTTFGQEVDSGQATRESSLVTLAQNLSLWVSSFKSPLRACFHPLWAPLVLLSLAAATLSGFRNSVAMVGLTYFVGLCYRGGGIQVMASALVGVVGLALLALINLTSPLPPNTQRALSFLPGTWEERYVGDAKGSSEWRFEIWREVLFTDRWISNKWLGDGLGFSARELQYQMSGQDTGVGVSGFDAHRESILASGDYHSGPVSSVRVVGYVGLVFFVLAQIRLAIIAHRQIVSCRKTEWFPIALFFGIPLLWAPIFFVLIFGDFKMAAASFLMSCGMLRLLQNNLPTPRIVW
ncbi:MAG: hypothetical protein EAZ71_06900 [Verrucomicrobia bacterium]|nr:MAG: hypothetical protein EAZ82_12515 [Verrucomicrobiota bacterium]TAF25865.1 MAG: hypothetical protein EAZ71_06900 [Verrucomicrobiota bacterium]